MPTAVYFVQNPHDETDAGLVARSQSGDSRAFEELVERHHKVLFTLALRMLGDREEAADVTQNTFLKLYEHLADYNPAHRFFSWAYRIVMNECLNVLRNRRPQAPLTDDIEVMDTAPDGLETTERRRVIQSALLALPIEQREVVVLRHFGDMSYQQMSDTLGIPAKTVKSRLHSARARLLQLLIDCGVSRSPSC